MADTGRFLSLGVGSRGAGFSYAAPLGLGSELHFETHEMLGLAHPSTFNLVPPSLIQEGVAFDQFKRAVLQHQIEWAISIGRHHCPAVPQSELERVEGKVWMKKAAATKCVELLKKARADMTAGGVKKVTVGVVSGYRSYERDTELWNGYFPKYYRATAKRRQNLPGGPHGVQAVHLLTKYIRGKKAAPGFSNHSNGMAVDFVTTEGKKSFPPDTDPLNRAAWRATWFHKWLVKNAGDFDFEPLTTEEWHWDFQG